MIYLYWFEGGEPQSYKLGEMLYSEPYAETKLSKGVGRVFEYDTSCGKWGKYYKPNRVRVHYEYPTPTDEVPEIFRLLLMLENPHG